MKTLRFDEHVAEIRPRARRYQLALRARSAHRSRRSRPRDPEMLENRLALARRRRQVWLDTGRLQKLGERHYRLKSGEVVYVPEQKSN